MIAFLNGLESRRGKGCTQVKAFRHADMYSTTERRKGLIQSAIKHFSATRHHHDFLAKPLCMLHHMGGKHDRGAALVFFNDQIFQSLLINRIKAREGFVQDQEIRAMRQRREDLNLLRHAFRELRHAAARKLAKPHHLEQLVGARFGIAVRQAFQARKIGDDLTRTHFFIEAAFFWQKADAFQGFQVWRRAEQADLPAIRRQDAKRHAEAGGFSGSVRPEKANNRTFRNVKVEAANRLETSKPFADPRHF
mmetsp:Transcript_19918/g.25689  ORF Transcript_19918/g.25689 Transcript_19918/m.25689 type:complete len:250 (-) Transcript_19918:85-834(-)